MFCAECSCENIETDKRCVRCGVNLFQNHMDSDDLPSAKLESSSEASNAKEKASNLVEETVSETIDEAISQGLGASAEGVFSGL
jgi:predicted  nucleic acid-binding Zn-ribbon protein